ncbi:MAG TPA: bifunctional transaldolase/phosoglucose isomerase [Chloroflexi bacterium]|nr:bifunctional transaldolase/phosoglucose isomerase [Chloroflexota bacterium]
MTPDTPITTLTSLGQSIWYDNIERRLLENGELAAMIQRGDIRGLTSNPSIFHKAIAHSRDYDPALLPMAWAGYEAPRIFERLAIEDIRAAADLLRPLYDQTGGDDGYVSLEVSPDLAYDTAGTLADARRLWELVDRPNLMIKIPATEAGLPAIRDAIAAGINVNVTLIFSVERYEAVMDAYLSGLERLLSSPPPTPPPSGEGPGVGEGLGVGARPGVGAVASVASFFVSRLDTKADARLQEIIAAGGPQAEIARSLLGKIAIANAKEAYARFKRVFTSERFRRLAARGARLQRPLWASTSTKNPAYPDTLYVDSLIGPHTVNTVPPKTLAAFKDHGTAALTLETGLEEARRHLAALESLGISLAELTRELEEEGVAAFAKAFHAMMKTIEERRQAARNQLGPLADSVARRVSALEEIAAPRRLWEHDPSLWTDDRRGAAEIRIRLGWLDAPQNSCPLLEPLAALRQSLQKDGIRRVLLLGMGGSSLAAEVIASILPPPSPPPSGEGPGVRVPFAVLDSTHPEQVLAAARAFPPSESLYLVASKSGTTAEPLAFLDYFWELTGGDGSRFVAVTDPGSHLESLGRERNFRSVILADPNVGGRYSALTAFGLTPAALMGADPAALLDRAAWMQAQSLPDVPAGRNPGLVLGAVLGQAALRGRDKLTLFADEPLGAFGAWLEQLIAESSGKRGQGILPVEGEPPADPSLYGADRIFVYLRRSGTHDAALDALRAAGHPALVLDFPDAYHLGAAFYRWEVAAAVACAIIGVNAFDQPDVQDAKARAKAAIAAYRQQGAFDEGAPAWESETAAVYGEIPPGAGSLAEIVGAFLAQGKAGDYVALNAFLPRTPEWAARLRELRIVIRERTHLATTLGFGPRFLHSTGQFHKGGPNNGLFLVFTDDPQEDADIPGQGLTFGALLRGQALGDIAALRSRGRRVLRVHLRSPEALKGLLQ